MDAATGKLGDVLYENPGYDFTGWLFRHPVTHEIVGLHNNTSGPRTVWFTDGYRNIQKALNAFFPGKIVEVIDSNKEGNRFLVDVFSDTQPPIYYWVDLEKHILGLVKNSSPWIDPARMQPMNVMKFKTRDGHELDAYVTMPTGASKQHPAPLVVLPHGGPWFRNVWGFDHEAQFLASRGYAVLQPNYRGSSGYGWMFPEKDRFAFRKMSDDVTDATKTLLASGMIDSRRIAIMGGSFGGYLAISGVAMNLTSTGAV
jgi:dipeptidyl aminopeptidase/acylaminoacyl peptidase